MNKIYSLVKTTISLIKIFYLTKYKLDNRKIILFYFPIKVYQENFIQLIKYIKSKKFLILLAYNIHTEDQIKKIQNSYFIDFGYLRYIPFTNFFLKRINFFISSYLTYIYPPLSKNVYISHDIYDAPMINKKMEKKMFIRINKLDYLFVASEVSKNYFGLKLKQYNNTINPNIINTGYSKLDLVHSLGKSKKIKKNYILIAPAYTLNYKNFNITKNLNEIINFLLNDLKEKVIYRPHPLDLTKKGDQNFVENIRSSYKDNKNFDIDISSSYLNSYNKSKLLITDITSTAYTFAFSMEKPVVFYSTNEKIIKNDKFFKINYIKDRNKVGMICKDFNELKIAINRINKNKDFLKKKIIKLRKNKIKYFKLSKQRTKKVILDILN